MNKKIQFEDRAVAFIDILGFKNIVDEAVLEEKKIRKLEELLELLETAIPKLNKNINKKVSNKLIPKHLYISDCIILSAPLKDCDNKFYDGLEIIVMRVIQLAQFFLNSGYLIRGGISVGKVFHTESNIVGPAYQEAYKLEAEGKEPIIELSDKAIKQLEKKELLSEINTKYFVNIFDTRYMQNQCIYGGIEDNFKHYQKIIEKKLKENLPLPAEQKWEWIDLYLKSEIKRRNK